MVIKSLQQLLEGKPLPEQTLTELEKWAEQYPYHLSPNLIRLLNERFEGPLEYDAHELNRIAFFMADRRQLFALIEGDGIPIQVNASEFDKDESVRTSLQETIEKDKSLIPTFDLKESLASSDEEISSLGDFLASLSKVSSIDEPIKSATMDGDFLTVIQSREVQGILERSKSSKSVEISSQLVSETYASILRNQGKYNEAIAVYKELMIQNPKKKRFFALQIEELQKNLSR